MTLFRDLVHDLRHGLRLMGRERGFTAVAVLTLALGVGAAITIFGVVHAVLLRPLPFRAQDQLVAAWKRDLTSDSPFAELSSLEFRDWQARSGSFSSLAALPTTAYGYGFVLTGHGEPTLLESSRVTGDFFRTLGVEPALGRLLDASDDRPGAARVVVIGDRLWREQFGADRAIIGQPITLGGDAYAVVGVLPPAFEYPRGVALWAPLHATMEPRTTENRGAIFLEVVGRLKPGVTRAAAQAELDGVIAGIGREHPEMDAAGERAVLMPLEEHLLGDTRPALWLLLAATGMLLLIGATNVANLLLARGAARRRELALRMALGAGRARLARQLATESALLAAAGGLLGLVVAHGMLGLLVHVAPADIPRIADVQLSLPVVGFALLVTLVTAALFVLLPALSVPGIGVQESLAEGSSRLSGDRRGDRTRRLLIAAEVAVATVLLVGATLVLRTFVALNGVELGFQPKNVLTLQLRPRGPQYATAETRRRFFDALIERVEAQPGVVAASAVLIRPLEGTVGWEADYAREGQSAAEIRHNPMANLEVVTPHYFETLGIPVVAGRTFTATDDPAAPRVAIVSRGLAERLFGSAAAAVGQRLNTSPSSDDGDWRAIVGVAGDVRYRELRDVRLDLYLPLGQSRSGIINHFAVRTALPAAAALPIVRRELAALDPTQAVSSIATMESLVDVQRAHPRFNAWLMNGLSALALFLALVGIHGVVAYSVAARTAELGVRVALGAQARDILGLVMRQGMAPVAAGIGIGTLTALLLGRLIRGLVFGVRVDDPLTLAAVAASLTTVALLTCWLPARRASRLDPVAALKRS